MQNLLEFLRRKAVAKQKESDQNCRDNESIYIFYKKSKKLISFTDKEPVQTKYE